ncbi:DUF2934 domain-containing protein [Hansschlegelia quercus]|uniref:DUF2934 domain-containing protein n=1 Tax=Hansschlegelia quercus TaxID=2528245 RepID=A0A4Q9GFQ7_9HYPH|nr:DUF2934 domain-containing protein [Hansschlegelia quercus]TBN51807.1 DUF2934 domain-containing protein [Hansschlegelia quercus]
MDELTQKIRERAFQLWEEAGRPEGQEDEHWAQAERDIRGSGDESESEESRLDKSLEETFPSSDPLSESQPGGGITGPGDESSKT